MLIMLTKCTKWSLSVHVYANGIVRVRCRTLEMTSVAQTCLTVIYYESGKGCLTIDFTFRDEPDLQL